MPCSLIRAGFLGMPQNDTPDEKSADERSLKLNAHLSSTERDLTDSTLVNVDNPHAVERHMQSLVGELIGERYKLREFIGQGGMSGVYKAQDLRNGKTVAVKLLLPHLVTDAVSFARFQLEEKAASSLHHPNIVNIFDFGALPNGQPFIVMDYLDGTGLQDAIKMLRSLPVERSVMIFTQLADALECAHKNGVLHRDLKPSNVLLLHQGPFTDVVKIVDFGIAKLMPREGAESLHLTKTGEVFGSPFYMSPEQCRGEKVDARSDIYSMGCLMYEVLAGDPPLVGNNLMETLLKHLSETPASFATACPDSKIPERLEKIVFKSLHKDPDQRYQSMAALRSDLDDCLANSEAGWFTRARIKLELLRLKMVPFVSSREKKFAVGFVAMAVLGFCLFSMLANIYMRDSKQMPPGPGKPWAIPQVQKAQEMPGFETSAAVAARILRTYEDGPERGSLEHLSELRKYAEYNEKNGHITEALTAYKRIYELNRQLDSPNSISTLQALSDYGACLSRAGENQEAEGVYKQLVSQTRRRSLTPSNEYFEALNKLADEEMKLKHYQDAQPLYEAVIGNVVKRRHDISDPQTYATLLCRLADCLRLSGNYERAIEFYDKALATWKSVKTEDDPQIYGTQRMLAYCHWQSGHYYRARRNYEEALAIMDRVLGESDQESTAALREYKELMWKKGNYLQAIQAHWKLQEIQARRKTTSLKSLTGC